MNHRYDAVSSGLCRLRERQRWLIQRYVHKFIHAEMLISASLLKISHCMHRRGGGGDVHVVATGETDTSSHVATTSIREPDPGDSELFDNTYTCHSFRFSKLWLCGTVEGEPAVCGFSPPLKTHRSRLSFPTGCIHNLQLCEILRQGVGF